MSLSLPEGPLLSRSLLVQRMILTSDYNRYFLLLNGNYVEYSCGNSVEYRCDPLCCVFLPIHPSSCIFILHLAHTLSVHANLREYIFDYIWLYLSHVSCFIYSCCIRPVFFLLPRNQQPVDPGQKLPGVGNQWSQNTR